MPWPVYVRTTEQPFDRATGSLNEGKNEIGYRTLPDKRGRGLHRFANVPEECAWLARFDRLVEALARDPDKFLRSFVDFSNRIGRVEVTVEPCHVRYL
jgi:hypothetical protein